MMTAVLGLSPDQAREVCATHAHLGVVEPSNFNSPGQVVIGGDMAAVREVMAAARAMGARRAVPLAVSAPFHTSLMRPAAERLAAEVERVPIFDASIPVVVNASAQPVRRVREIRQALIDQVASPVLWEATVRSISDLGIRRFVEIGPGTTLSGMIRKTVPAASIAHVEDAASREDALAMLAAEPVP